MLLNGRRIDRYHFVRLLRSGGMGEVYLADDELLQRHVAIKVIWTDASHYADREEAREASRLFLREARAIAQLDHMHILPVYGSDEGSVDGIPFMYMVMPFRHEGSFTDWLQKHRRLLTPWEVEHIVRQASSALQHAHNHNIIHLDIKPSNFLIHGEAEQPDQLNLQLADFGVAKLMTTTSKTQTIRGTPTHMAPEQWDGHPVPATDQYALAVMAYELLTGRPPFEGNNSQQLWYQHFYKLPLSPRAINPSIPAELDTVLLRALAKNPLDRFASISAFAHAFQQALLSSSPKKAETVSLAEATTIENTIPVFNGNVGATRTPHWKRGFGVRAVLQFCLVLVFVGASLGIFYFTRSYQQGIANATATASAGTSTAISRSTATTQANATSTGQVNATSTADAHATETAQINAAATAQMATATEATAQVISAHATATMQAANATATVEANAMAYAMGVADGHLVLDDPLQDNSKGNWDITTVAGGGGCAFTEGAYHSTMPQTGSYSTCFEQTSFSNFAYEVQMTIVKGDQGGICFRADRSKGSFYYFHINTSGLYALETYNGDRSITILASGSSSAININLNQPNLLRAIAIGSQLSLYVNTHYLTTVTDSTYGQGQLGVVADNIRNPTDVAFSNVKVWTF